MAHHHLLDGKRGHGGYSAMGVVTFHVAGRAGEERLALELARRLRSAGQRIDLGHDCDFRMPGAPLCPNMGRHAGAAQLDLEARCLQRLLEQPRAFELLHSGLAEKEDGIADQRHLLGIAIDDLESELLAFVAGGRLAAEREEKRKDCRSADLTLIFADHLAFPSSSLKAAQDDFRPPA